MSSRHAAFDTERGDSYLPRPTQKSHPPQLVEVYELQPVGFDSTNLRNLLLSRCRILIVDPSTDSREVLQTLFQRRGARTWGTARIRHACQLAQKEQPDVIVLDGDDRGRNAEEAVEELGGFASRSSTPIVVLGTLQRHTSPLAAGHFVSKPYHYAALIRRIEEILGNRV